MTLRGAGDFRRRLNAIRDTGVLVAKEWTEEGTDKVRAEIPRVTGATAASIHGEVSRDGGQILGSRVVRYLAGGTRAHTEEPTTKTVMKFDIGANTIFSKRVMHPATPANPRIFDAAKNALGSLSKACAGLWNKAA